MRYKLHREGTKPLLFSGLLALGVCALVWVVGLNLLWGVAALGLFGFVFQFFIVPKRAALTDSNLIYAPANGRILAVEPWTEREYLKKDEYLRVVIFMSPLDPHVNCAPVSGKVVYQKYHAGAYKVAFHKKDSDRNEHTSCVFETATGHRILVRQIAGFVARRIACYVSVGDTRKAGEEFGFIRFGSRVDMVVNKTDFQPLVKKGDYVRFAHTPIGKWRSTPPTNP